MGKIIDFIRAVAGKENSTEETNLAYIIANRISILKGANNKELMKEPKAAEMLLARYNSAKSQARQGFERIAIRGNKIKQSNLLNEKEKNNGRQNNGEELIL